MKMERHEFSLRPELAERQFHLCSLRGLLRSEICWGSGAVHLGSCDRRPQQSGAGLSEDLCLHCIEYIQY